MTQDDVEVLVVEAFACTSDLQFVLELDYSVAGRTGRRIDDDGQPLRVTGVNQQTLRYTYNSIAAPGLHRTAVRWGVGHLPLLAGRGRERR